MHLLPFSAFQAFYRSFQTQRTCHDTFVRMDVSVCTNLRVSRSADTLQNPSSSVSQTDFQSRERPATHFTMAFILPSSALLLPLLLISVAAMPDRCPSGTIRVGSNCKPCPPGTYHENPYADTCTPCPRGTYFPYIGGQGLDVCLPCPAGTFNAIPRATSTAACLKCPPGTDSPPASRRCLACLPGTYYEPCPSSSQYEPPPFRGVCLFCNPGVDFEGACSSDGFTNPRCVKCRSGTFSSTANALSCDRCPPGMTSSPGSSTCRPGPSTSCGFFRVAGVRTGVCEDCPPGFIGDSEVGSTKCVPCPVGTFKNESVPGTCQACPAGQNTGISGASFCLPDRTPCPPNYFRATTGACQHCTKFQRYNRRTNRCMSCPEGSFSDGNLATRCRRCPKNMELVESIIGRPECRCRPGWGWKEGSEGKKCVKCAKGTAGGGNFYCLPCSPGRYAPRRGLERCLDCPLGTLQPQSGQSRCVSILPCPKGLIPSLHAGCVNPATNCPPDHDRNVVYFFNLPQCIPDECPAGTARIYFDDRMREVSCGTCSPGWRYDASLQQCVSCPDNETSKGGLSTVCSECKLGKVFRSGQCRCVGARRLTKGRCKVCPPGTIGFSRRDGCVACPAGSFNRVPGSLQCEQCPVGTFTDKEGSTSCTPCSAATTNFRAGETGCVKVGSLRK